MPAMNTTPPRPDALTALRDLSRDEIDRRLTEIESERQALMTIRRALSARDRVRGQTSQTEDGRDD